jgi:predicted restriction endonuclease
MLVLCPNHHTDFDNGMIAIQPGDYSIVHNYDETLTGSTLYLNQSHTIAETFLQYHLDEIAVTSLI